MTFKLLSKFSVSTGNNFFKNVICLKYSMYYKSSQNVKPINMAFTTYETINPESENEVPILILHGVLGSKSNWNTMGRQIALKTLRKVITLDLRNHGDSPHTKEFSYAHIMADIEQVIKEMDLKEVSFIGHSIGGRAMMAYALSYPDLVRDLIAVDISPVNISKSVHKFPAILSAMKNIKLPSTAITLMKAREEADTQLKTSVQDKSVRDFLLMNLAFDEKKKRFFWKVNLPSLIQKLHGFIDFPFNGVFDKPTLFIAGGKSDFVRREDEPLIVKKFPKSQFEYVENSGHIVHIEKPTAFLNIVSKFYDERDHQSAVLKK